jgi:hypothetical protein
VPGIIVDLLESSAVAELTRWLHQLDHPVVWYQIAVLLLAAAGAWAVQHSLGGRLLAEVGGLQRFTLRSVQRVMFPFTMLLGVVSGRAVLQALDFPTAILNIAVPLLLSLAAIRFLVYGLRKGFPVTPMLKAWENIIGFTIWALVALHLLGWLPAVLEAMDNLALNVGSARISLLSSLKLVMLIGLLMTLAFWVSGVLERRMKASTHVTPALQVALAKFSKILSAHPGLSAGAQCGGHRLHDAHRIRWRAGCRHRLRPAAHRQQLHQRLHPGAGSLHQARRRDLHRQQIRLGGRAARALHRGAQPRWRGNADPQ